MKRNGITLTAPALALALLSTAHPALADGLDRFSEGVARLRGVGHADVTSYRVTVTLPEDEDEETVPLQEMWRAPADAAIRAVDTGTSRAIVRGLAIYLEPLYVARASFLSSDLAEGTDILRERCEVSETDGGDVRVDFPAEADEAIPEELRDLAWLEAALDDRGRIARLALATRDGDEVELRCSYADGDTPQPAAVQWRLPNDERVDISTEFVRHEGRALPARRTVVFPSRYEPGGTEEIVVAYGDWRLNVPVTDEDLGAPGAFRYDAGGLVTE